MDQILMSIIMPIRNEEQYIYESLRSILQQDIDPSIYEVLIIDGMSTDGTRPVIHKVLADYAQLQYHDPRDRVDEESGGFKPPRVRLFDNPRKIVPTGMNIGLRHAEGKIIVRVDGHAVLSANYLQQCQKYLVRTGAECVGGVIISQSSTFIGRAISLAMSSPFGVGNARFRTSGKEGPVDSVAFGAYRRSVFDEVGYFDEELVRCQDDEFNYRLRKHGGRIYFTPAIRSVYYVRTRPTALWKQYFQYGFWKTRVMQKHPGMMQPRQFAPALFVLILFFSGLIGFFFQWSGWLLLTVVLAYILLSLTSAVVIGCKHGLSYTPLLPGLFLTLHLSYGFGFLFGLIKHVRFWSEKNSTFATTHQPVHMP
jgi:succinoglycan biosynthesis protein ExoA